MEKKTYAGLSFRNLLFFIVFLTFVFSFTVQARALQTWTNGEDATVVLGQTDFSSNTEGANQFKMTRPRSVAVDPVSAKVFICDPANSRVLRFASCADLANGQAAEGVLGQPDFTSITANRGLPAPTAATMNVPYGLHVDQDGRLWVADQTNCRVLRFDDAANKANGADADGVLGQPDFVTKEIPFTLLSGTPGYKAVSQSSMTPSMVFADTDGRLWVLDSSAHRVLRIDDAASKNGLVDADGVLGQADFVSFGTATTQSGFSYPYGIYVDAAGRLWIGDRNNNRVLRFDDAANKANGANADGVLGQADFNSATGGLTQNKFKYVGGVTGDSSGRIYVHDQNNHRIMIFDDAANKADGANADNVLGQADFVSGTANRGTGTAANTLNSTNTSRFFYDPVSEVLWMPDDGNNRVLRYGTCQRYPTVTTQAVSNMNGTTATGNGNLTDLGAPDPTQHGLVWDTNTGPTTALATKTENGAPTSIGAFTGELTGLTVGTTYYVRAYATNAKGTAYGGEVSFTAVDSTTSYTLNVTKDGNGTGTVTSSPEGIDCGGDCSETYDEGNNVTLTGTPDDGSALDGWTGADCPGNAGCTVAMNQDYTVNATFNPDGDGDGISDDVENRGPNNGDGNGDGIPDSTQNNVATFQDTVDDWCTLVSPDGTTLKNVTARVNPSPGDTPAGQSFPLGFFGFTVQGVTTGDPVLVTLIVHQMDTGIIGYYKYGPTPDDNTDHWYQYNNVTISHSAADNQTVISLVLIDGQTGDGDLTVNSVIVDPGAPAAETASGGGDSGGGCSCNGSAIAGDGHKSGKADFDIGVVLFAFMGVMLVFYRRLKRHLG